VVPLKPGVVAGVARTFLIYTARAEAMTNSARSLSVSMLSLLVDRVVVVRSGFARPR
jgi:hypothetical protein